MKRAVSLFLMIALLVAAVPVTAARAAEEEALPLAASGMVLAGDSLYVADSYHRSVWVVKDGRAELLAGQASVTDLSGQPVEGYRDGAFTQAAFSEPWAIVPYRDGLLVSDSGNHVLRYLDLTTNRVYTAAGTGAAGYRDGAALSAAFDAPAGLAVGDDGTVYIADTGNNVIRAMDEDGTVTTYAGGEEGCALGTVSEARFSQPTGLCWADGVLYVADSGNHRVVAIQGGQVTLVAGAELTGDAAYEGGYLNGPAELARFASPQGVAVGADGTVYVADTGNGAVRAIREGYVTTLLSPDPSGTYPISPRSLLCHGNALYMGDVFAKVLVSLSAKVAGPVFYDVKEETWYAQAVRFTAANGLFAGIEEHVFAPDIPMTRAMIVTILARLEGVDTSGDPWYEAGRQWAMEQGISDGTNMDASLTREQLATMLWRYAGSPAVSADMSGYTDTGTVSSYAQQAMAWCVEQGIIGGTTATTLSPQAEATRAQVATILMRFIEGMA